MNSVGKEFGQNTVGMTCLWAMMCVGPQLGSLKCWGDWTARVWKHLKSHSLTCLAVDVGCWLEPQLGCQPEHKCWPLHVTWA